MVPSKWKVQIPTVVAQHTESRTQAPTAIKQYTETKTQAPTVIETAHEDKNTVSTTSEQLFDLVLRLAARLSTEGITCFLITNSDSNLHAKVTDEKHNS